MKTYIHTYERDLQRRLAYIESTPDISKENKSLILEFYRYNKLNGFSIPRLLKHLDPLKLVALGVKKDFSVVTRPDYEAFILKLMERDLSKATVSTYMEILKVFHKWLGKSDTYPDCVKWMRCGGKKSRKLPETLLTQEDVKLLLSHSSNARDTALISILWESGARIGEIGGMDIKDVAFDELGCRIMVDGKTGMRRIRLVNSSNALLQWLNQHPFRNNPEYALFVNMKENYGDRMGHQNIMKILSRTAIKAGVTKPVIRITSGTRAQPTCRSS